MRSIFQPTFGFNGGLERSACARFRGCRFGSLSRSLVSQLPVRLVTINRGQGEHKGRRRVSIGNTLTAEVSLDFKVSKGHSLKSGAPLVFCREGSGVHSSRASADRRRVSSGMSHQSLPFGGRQIAPRVGLELAASYCQHEIPMLDDIEHGRQPHRESSQQPDSPSSAPGPRPSPCSAHDLRKMCSKMNRV